MKILNISPDAHREHFDATKIHTISLADNLILLKNKICLIIKGNREELINYQKNDLITLKFKPLKGSFLKKLYNLFYNNYLIFRDIKKYKLKFDIIYERHNVGFLQALSFQNLKKFH
jgi:hypothetical protein